MLLFVLLFFSFEVILFHKNPDTILKPFISNQIILDRNETNELLQPDVAKQLLVLQWIQNTDPNATTKTIGLNHIIQVNSTISLSSFFPIPYLLNDIVRDIRFPNQISPSSKHFRHHVTNNANICYGFSTPGPCLVGFGSSLATLYNIPLSGTLVQPKIGLFEWCLGVNSCGYDIMDLLNVTNGITPTIELRGTQSLSTAGLLIETVLDLYMILAWAPTAHIVLWLMAPSASFESFAANVLSYSNAELPNIISISYGGIESGLSPSELTATNQLFQAIAARGITLVVSSGDSGAVSYDVNSHTGSYQVEFPASSPYVLSVAGTEYFNGNPNTTENSASSGILCGKSITSYNGPIVQLSCLTNPGTTSSLSTTTQYGSAFTSGGGVSQFFQQSQWQSLLTSDNSFIGNTSSYPLPSFDPVPYLGNRIVPDIAMYGSFTPIYFNQVLQIVDGTSVSAPLMAVLLLILQNYTVNHTLGFFPPLLYQIYYNNSYNQTGLIDVVTGDNSLIITNPGYHYYPGYTAVKNFDAATGIGSINDFLLFKNQYLAVTNISFSVPPSTPDVAATAATSDTTLVVETVLPIVFGLAFLCLILCCMISWNRPRYGRL